MKTDSIFYRLFQTAPGILLELAGRSATQAEAYRFRSVEIKQTAFRIDGVLLPIDTSLLQPIYFCEIQFQKDMQLYHRFFAEVFLYLSQHPKTADWQGIVIYPDRSLEPPKSKLFQELLDSAKVQRIYLNELGSISELPLGISIMQLIIEPEATAPVRARQLIARSQQETVAGVSSPVLIELIETIIVYKFIHLSREEIEAMLGLDNLKQTRVYQEALQEGQREVIESLLRARFGELDTALVAIVEPLLQLPPAEYMPLLLHRSREELIAQFTP
ncbi:Rpn family recombination-promoting nuclease/putative transposase [Egbenema bharatensis]|uniref:Rpn family recombination-promoting nuclease/putative transposase n=1 Tax=Egbenema bharatensis TaxID=3463334 RepID=UPI003A886EB5